MREDKITEPGVRGGAGGRVCSGRHLACRRAWLPARRKKPHAQSSGLEQSSVTTNPRLFRVAECHPLRQARCPTLRSQSFAMRQVIAVPAAQGGVAGVGKQKLQRWRFNVAVAKHHVESALMARERSF